MKRHLVLLILVLLLPSILGLTALLGVSKGQTNAERMTAAIVNEDEIATLPDGTSLPGGRQIIATLTKADAQGRQSLDWSVVTAATAAQGLTDGTYDAVVTIPQSFSQSLADVLTAGSGTVPTLSVELSAGASRAYGEVTSALVDAAADDFGTSLTVSSLTQSLEASGTIASSLSDAAEGATRIAEGQEQAAQGATTLAQGSSELSSGAQSLASGLRALETGLHSADASMLSTLPDQLGTASDATATLATTASTLDQLISACQAGQAAACSGASQYAQGIASGAQTLSAELAAGQAAARSGASSLEAQLSALDSGLAQARGGAESLSTGINALASGIEDSLLGANAQALTAGAEALADGAHELAAGSATASEGASALSSGAANTASGADSLAEGTRTLDAGASLLDSSMPEFTSGASELAAGSTTLAERTTSLDSGAHSLASGLGDLRAGSTELADGLASAAEQVPSFTSEEAAASAEALASPIDVEAASSVAPATRSWAPTAAVLALWLAAMVAALAFGALNRRRVSSAATPVGLAWSSLWPNLILSTISSLLLGASLLAVGVEMARPLAAFAVLLGAALVLAMVHEALIAAFGQRMGVFVSILLLTVQAVLLNGVAPIAAQSGFLASIRGALPLPAVEDGLTRAILGSGQGSSASQIALLLVWGAASVLVTIGAVVKRRRTSLAELRAEAAA